MDSRARARWLTIGLVGLTALVLALSLPGALRDAYERGGIYLLSREFLEDVPKRLTGPGRFRFLLQPAFAIALGIGAGRADRGAGRPPYLQALLLGSEPRRELVRSAGQEIVNLLLMGILLDAASQWLILGVSHPGAALVVGPVLITVPYAVARGLANRLSATAGRSPGA